MPMATARSPEPQSWFSPQAVASFGTPAAIAAWRAGFWPCAAVRIWPRMTSCTSSGATPARSSAPLMATAPSSCAASVAKAPLKEPTGVRAALAMTMSFTGNLLDRNCGGQPARRDVVLHG